VLLIRIGKEQILQFLDALFDISAVLLHRIGFVAVGVVVLEPLGILLLEISQFLSHFLEIVTAISLQLFDLCFKVTGIEVNADAVIDVGAILTDSYEQIGYPKGSSKTKSKPSGAGSIWKGGATE